MISAKSENFYFLNFYFMDIEPTPISEKQLTANQENAKLGGVKTEAGKAISKYNATKHGLFSKNTLIKNENEKELDELNQCLRESLEPETETESILVETIVSAIWRLKRAHKIEAEMINESIEYEIYDPSDVLLETPIKKERSVGKGFMVDVANDNSLEKCTRYLTSIERSFYKALHELQRLQAVRKGKEVSLPAVLDVNTDKDE